jgi:4'-phosphopantetheinyl transferase
VNSADRYLSPEERVRRDRLRFGADRRDFTIAHDLLRRTLSYYKDVPPGDWQFATNEHGKPSIDSVDPQLGAMSFSLSHTRGCVACAIAPTAPVGVDIERIDRSLSVQEIADRYFSEDEAVWLRRCSDEIYPVRFAELWTLKEAFLKAMGVGLSGSLASVTFRLDQPGRILFTAPSVVEHKEWHFALFDLGSNMRLGVAIRSGGQPRFTVRQDGVDRPPVDPVGVSD